MRKIIYLLILALAIAVQNGSAQDRSSKPGTLYVTVESTKTDFITGLNAGHFKIFENKAPQKITFFGEGTAPMSVGILFDVSDSLRNLFPGDLDEAAAGISAAVRAQPAGNDYFLMAFNKQVTLLADWTKDSASIETGLENRESVQRKGQGATTLLYDACFQAIEKLNAGKHEKKVLIVFTDGIDGSSKHLKKEVVDLARDSNIQVYTLTVREAMTVDINSIENQTPARGPIDPPGPNKGPASQFLRDITDFTGGTAHIVPSTAPGNLDREFKSDERSLFRKKLDLVFAALRSQYTIKYSPQSTGGDEFRKVDVKLVLTPEMREGKGSVSLKFREKFKPAE
jgi:VWFA-related protein